MESNTFYNYKVYKLYFTKLKLSYEVAPQLGNAGLIRDQRYQTDAGMPMPD